MGKVAVLPQFCATLDDVFNERFSLNNRVEFPLLKLESSMRECWIEPAANSHIEQGHPLYRILMPASLIAVRLERWC
ncbi:MAG: hypothetical protein IPO97_10535 [Sphingomonadales bacterium]|nr:hypothetical protein [Sphingomonadales bacterium]